MFKNACLLFLIVIILSGCKSESTNDNTYFNGKINYFTDSNVPLIKAEGTPVEISAIPSFEFAVCDSLMICLMRQGDYIYNIINLKDGELINSFFRRGRGPKEWLSVTEICDTYIEEGYLKTMLSSYSSDIIIEWNISESLKHGELVIDHQMTYNDEKEGTAVMTNIFKMYNGNIVGKLQSEYRFNDHDKPTLIYFQERDWTTGDLLKNFQPYKESIKNDQVKHLSSNHFFYSFDAMSPDNKKIVQAMHFIPQLNIIDLETGEITGFRPQGAPGFGFFKTDMDPHTKYYTGCQADDNFIYCLYNGGEFESNDQGDKHMPRTIHVFDWNGEMVGKIDLGREVWHFQLDRVNNLIYTIDRYEEMYCYDLNKLPLK